MKRPRVQAPSSPLAAIPLLLVLSAACGGGAGGGQALGLQPPGATLSVEPLVLQAVGTPLRPFGMVGEQVVGWRASLPVAFSIELAAADGSGLVEELSSGQLEAFETVSVTLTGADLHESGSVLRIRVVDELGREVLDARPLERAEVDEFVLGLGEHVDLAFDATRDELLVANRQTGITQIVDVDPDAAGYGQVVALLPPGPDAGPLGLVATADGLRGYNLNRTTLLGYDLATLTVEENLFLPGGFEPTSIDVTPDSSRVYIGYYHTLLFHRIDAPGEPAAVESTDLYEGLMFGGDVAVSPDGALVLYAWYGDAVRGLWIVGGDPASPDYHELLDEKLFTQVPPTPVGPVLPKVAVAPSGAQAFVGVLSGLSRVELQAPDYPITASRDDLAFTGLTAVQVDGRDLVVLIDPLGTLTVLDADLELVAALEMPPLLVERSAYDPARGRLFLVSQQQQTSGRLLVVPLR